MQVSADLAAVVAWCSFGLSFIFGAVGHKTHFCAMGAVSDVVNMSDWNRMRMLLLAIAVAVLGANALHLLGYVDLSKSIYQTPNFNWLGYIFGGLLFGFGMTLSSGCGSRALIRLGGGNLKSLVVYVFLAISSYMTLKGLFGTWRVAYIQPVSVDFAAHAIPGQDLPSLLAAITGIGKKTLQLLLMLLIAGGMLAFIFADNDFRESREKILGGIIIGLVVVAGWYVTGHLGYAENPETLEMTFFGTNTHTVESFSFVAPLAYSLELLLLWSDNSLHVTFGVAAVGGVLAGSFAYAIASGNFRIESFRDARDTANHILGGVLMGFGGVTALGCTIGQGISGFSTLALGSIITLLAIVFGSAATMKYQYWKMLREA
jgi:uncharacterized membrane protein YedE/YeeE